MVDIGGGSTEIAVISLGGIVSNNSIRTAGDDLTAEIQEYMSKQHNVKVSERMAERIKIHVGSALTDLGEEAPEDYVVHGPNKVTALPMEVPVCYQEIAHCLDRTIAKIENAVLSALEKTPPELYADIVKNGIYLTGGGALLRGLDKRLTDKIKIPFHVADDPCTAWQRERASPEKRRPLLVPDEVSRCVTCSSSSRNTITGLSLPCSKWQALCCCSGSTATRQRMVLVGQRCSREGVRGRRGREKLFQPDPK